MRRLATALGLALWALLAGAADDTAAERLNPRYLLMDAKGRAVTNETFPGQFQLISFGYTYCPDVCPTTLAEVATVLQQLGERAARVRPIFITVDPARDTPDALQKYADFFDPRILALSGQPALIARVAQNYKVRYEIVRAHNAAPEAYSVDHSAGLYLLDPRGDFLKKFAFGTPIEQITATINNFIDQAPPPRH